MTLQPIALAAEAEAEGNKRASNLAKGFQNFSVVQNSFPPTLGLDNASFLCVIVVHTSDLLWRPELSRYGNYLISFF